MHNNKRVNLEGAIIINIYAPNTRAPKQILAELKGEMQLYKNSRRLQYSIFSRITRQKIKKDTEDLNNTADK